MVFLYCIFLFPLKFVSPGKLQPSGKMLSTSPYHLGSHKTGPKTKTGTNNLDFNYCLSDLKLFKDISSLCVVNCEHMTTRHEGRLKVSQLELF